MRKKDASMHGIFRIETQPKGTKTAATRGWQVRIEREKHHHSQLFSDNKYPSKEEALKAAIKYRDELLVKLGRTNRARAPRIVTTLLSNNTSGIVGVCRAEQHERNGNLSASWQTTYPSLDGKAICKKFSINKNGELNALKLAVEARMYGISELVGSKEYKYTESGINKLIDTYLDILIYLDSLSDAQSEELFSIINNKNIVNTKKEDIILGRIGQASFRDRVLRLWGNKCAITGATIFLTAGHIKPWKDATDKERLDPYNGIPFSPVYDKAFDKGYITFNDDGTIIISSELGDNIASLGISPTDVITGLNPLSYKYLEYHRVNVFRGQALT